MTIFFEKETVCPYCRGFNWKWVKPKDGKPAYCKTCKKHILPKETMIPSL